ncbi:MAG: hypothetical protein ACRDKE_00140 [Solirubrobacterales bacterium]
MDKLINAFGHAVVKRDHEALDILLAPWISVNEALEKFRANFDSMLAEWELPAGSWPTDFAGGAASLTFEQLSEPSEFPPGLDIPARVDAENYVGWSHITFFPPEDDEAFEFDAYCDAWFAVVQVAGTQMVGSLELVDPD